MLVTVLLEELYEAFGTPHQEPAPPQYGYRGTPGAQSSRFFVQLAMNTAPDFRLLGIDSLEEFEAAMSTVHANRNADIGVFATALDKRRSALRDAAFLQLILTWARLSPSARLHVLSNAGTPEQDVLEEACGYAVGIAAIAIAGGVTLNGKPIPRAMALAPARERIEWAYQGEFDFLMKGRTVDLLCVSGAERQYLKPLFSGPSSKAVKDKYDLKATVRALASRAGSGIELDDGTVAALATLTHELVENMQEHAVTNAAGRAYRRHVELVTASWMVLSDEASRNDLTANRSLKRYWEGLARIQPGGRQVAGVCFSFLDSGPGMAARLTGREYFEMPFEEEREALRECLRMHVTSKKEQGTGGGLQAMLTEVAQASGFVRVRSGRQAIFRCFAPDDAIGNVSDHFEDWYEGKSELYRAAGTLISVFIPLPRRSA